MPFRIRCRLQFLVFNFDFDTNFFAWPRRPPKIGSLWALSRLGDVCDGWVGRDTELRCYNMPSPLSLIKGILYSISGSLSSS